MAGSVPYKDVVAPAIRTAGAVSDILDEANNGTICDGIDICAGRTREVKPSVLVGPVDFTYR